MQFDAPVKLWIVREHAQRITAVFRYRDTLTARTIPAVAPPEKPSAWATTGVGENPRAEFLAHPNNCVPVQDLPVLVDNPAVIGQE
jgi:hypothetical protein